MDAAKEARIKEYKDFLLAEPLEDFIMRFCISGMGDIYQRMNGDLDWIVAMQDILRERFKKEKELR